MQVVRYLSSTKHRHFHLMHAKVLYFMANVAGVELVQKMRHEGELHASLSSKDSVFCPALGGEGAGQLFRKMQFVVLQLAFQIKCFLHGRPVPRPHGDHHALLSP